MALPAIALSDVSKGFTMHLRGAARLPVLSRATLAVMPGECVVLGGPSGAGKSSLLKVAYGNYRCDAGAVRVAHDGGVVDVATASPREVMALRRATIGYVSQFLRVIPRVGALEVVAAAARAQGRPPAEADAAARAMLARLNLPERLWGLAPATFSGGEQQRVNIARGFVGTHAVLLLDEPTASLDAANRDAVVSLIDEKKAAGVAILGIFHDEDVRDRVADRVVDVTSFSGG